MQPAQSVATASVRMKIVQQLKEAHAIARFAHLFVKLRAAQARAESQLAEQKRAKAAAAEINGYESSH